MHRETEFKLGLMTFIHGGMWVWQVEKELGERRAVGYSGVGLGISEELDFEAIAKESNNVGNVSRNPYCLIYAICRMAQDQYHLMVMSLPKFNFYVIFSEVPSNQSHDDLCRYGDDQIINFVKSDLQIGY